MSWSNDRRIAEYKDIVARKQLRGETAVAELQNIAQLEAENQRERDSALQEEARRAERRLNDEADRREQDRARRERARDEAAAYEKRMADNRERDRRDEHARQIFLTQQREQALEAFIEKANDFVDSVGAYANKYLPDHNEIGYLLFLWEWAGTLQEQQAALEEQPADDDIAAIQEAFDNLTDALSRQGIEDPQLVSDQMQRLLYSSYFVDYYLEYVELNPLIFPAGEADYRQSRLSLEGIEKVIADIEDHATTVRDLTMQLGSKYAHQTKKGEWVWTERFSAHNFYAALMDILDSSQWEQFDYDDRGRYFKSYALCMHPEQLAARLEPYKVKAAEVHARLDSEHAIQLELLEKFQDKPDEALTNLMARPVHFTDWPAWGELKGETPDAKALSGGYLSVAGAVVTGGAALLAGRIFGSTEIRFLGGSALVLAVLGGLYVGYKSFKYRRNRGLRAYQATRHWLESTLKS